MDALKPEQEQEVQFFEDTSNLEDILRDSSAEFINGSYGIWQLAGHGHQTNDSCGVFRSFWGCLHVENHDIIASDGKNHKGEMYGRKVRCSCGKMSCPICYKSACGREAHKIEERLAEASKQFGEVEHLSATFPLKFWHLTYEQLRAKAIKMLMARGIIGGCLIWHGARWDKVRLVWYWSPHFHVLGFILGGYGKCRGCPKCHKGCGGFVDRNYRAFEKDECIVRIFGKRKMAYGTDKPNVGGTASYQLGHATLKKDVERFHVATYFGVCSYRKLKVTVEKRKMLCPICEQELEKIRYNGNRFVMNEHLSSNEKFFFEVLLDELGIPKWVRDVG